MERDCSQFLAMPPPPRHYASAAADEGHRQFLHQLVAAAGSSGGDPAAGTGGGGSGERKRRFTDEQVRSLETTFHARRAKLEPREKAELARELGLQPRQVAIWFQNKRARWRSKQLEQDYAALRAQYDALHARVDALRHDNQTLAAQVEELKGRLNGRQPPPQDQSGSCDTTTNGGGAEVDGKGNPNHSGSVVEDDGAAAAAPAVVAASEESSVAGVYEYDDMDAFGGGLPEPFFCAATPELWDTWPLVEWNAVA